MLPVLVYAAIAARYVSHPSLPALQVIALFTMGPPALVAILRVYLAHLDRASTRHLA